MTLGNIKTANKLKSVFPSPKYTQRDLDLVERTRTDLLYICRTVLRCFSLLFLWTWSKTRLPGFPPTDVETRLSISSKSGYQLLKNDHLNSQVTRSAKEPKFSAPLWAIMVCRWNTYGGHHLKWEDKGASMAVNVPHLTWGDKTLMLSRPGKVRGAFCNAQNNLGGKKNAKKHSLKASVQIKMKYQNMHR